jgi:hypothetical protein
MLTPRGAHQLGGQKGSSTAEWVEGSGISSGWMCKWVEGAGTGAPATERRSGWRETGWECQQQHSREPATKIGLTSTGGPGPGVWFWRWGWGRGRKSRGSPVLGWGVGSRGRREGRCEGSFVDQTSHDEQRAPCNVKQLDTFHGKVSKSFSRSESKNERWM